MRTAFTAPAKPFTTPAQRITAPDQQITAPAQLITARAQRPATEVAVYTALINSLSSSFFNSVQFIVEFTIVFIGQFIVHYVSLQWVSRTADMLSSGFGRTIRVGGFSIVTSISISVMEWRWCFTSVTSRKFHRPHRIFQGEEIIALVANGCSFPYLQHLFVAGNATYKSSCRSIGRSVRPSVRPSLLFWRF